MTTTWTPLTRYQKKEWLLANGEVVTEPELEQSPSGRKVRVVGTTVSAYYKDLDDLLQQTVVRIAETRGTKLWMVLDRANEINSLGFDRRQETKAQINFVSNSTQPTTLWWRFKHAELPIEATIVIKVEAMGLWQTRNNSPFNVESAIVWQDTALDHISTTTDLISEDDQMFAHGRARTRMSYDDQLLWDAFIRDNPPIWNTAALGEHNLPNTRTVAKQVLKMLRSYDELSAIDIPDFRDFAKPGWLRLELFDSNVHAGIEQELVDLLDGEVTVKEAVAQYQEFRNTLRKLGIVIEEREENNFLAALNGNKEPLTVIVQQPLSEGGGFDRDHSLSMHLPSGTMYVHCTKAAQDLDAVAEKWEEAQLIASLSGKEDELLAYAREYANRKQASVMKQLVKDRDVTD